MVNKNSEDSILIKNLNFKKYRCAINSQNFDLLNKHKIYLTTLYKIIS